VVVSASQLASYTCVWHSADPKHVYLQVSVAVQLCRNASLPRSTWPVRASRSSPGLQIEHVARMLASQLGVDLRIRHSDSPAIGGALPVCILIAYHEIDCAAKLIPASVSDRPYSRKYAASWCVQECTVPISVPSAHSAHRIVYAAYAHATIWIPKHLARPQRSSPRNRKRVHIATQQPKGGLRLNVKGSDKAGAHLSEPSS